MSIRDDRKKYLEVLSHEIYKAGYESNPKVGILMKKREFFDEAFKKYRMTIKDAEEAWSRQYDPETGQEFRTPGNSDSDSQETGQESDSQAKKIVTFESLQKEDPYDIADRKEETGRYLTFTMVVLLIGLIASFIVYYNDNDREVAFWVGVGLSAALFLLIIFYFFVR